MLSHMRNEMIAIQDSQTHNMNAVLDYKENAAKASEEAKATGNFNQYALD